MRKKFSFSKFRRWLGKWPFQKMDLKGYLNYHDIYLKGITLNAGSGSQDYQLHLPDEISVDIDFMCKPCVVGDLHCLPIASASINNVIALCVLEHVKNPISVVFELARVLKPEGLLLIEVPFINPYHAAPHDYFRFTVGAMNHLLESAGFTVINTSITQPVSYGFLWHAWQQAKTRQNQILQIIALLVIKMLSRLCGVSRFQFRPWLPESNYAQFIMYAVKSSECVQTEIR